MKLIQTQNLLLKVLVFILFTACNNRSLEQNVKPNIIIIYADDFKEKNDVSKKFPGKLEELKKKLLNACDGDYNNGFYL